LKILVIEDDQETADFIVNGLMEEGHVAAHTMDGNEGLSLATDGSFDLLLVDRMLPGLDGLQLVKFLRTAGNMTPALFLTTLGGIDDRVSGLNAGGDDYLVKPFAFAELAARVSALGRRSRTRLSETKLSVADLELDLVSRMLHRNGRPIDLQPREFRLLEYLMRHTGQTVTRTMLLENVWDLHFDPHTNVVETQMSRLRCKIRKGDEPEVIHTIRGVGYCLRAHT
jgi:two-component system, OmpR family, response regulator